MDRFKRYLHDRFELFFVVAVIVSVAAITYFLPNRLAFLHFFFLPVILAGYLSGMRLSVLGAALCVILVTLYSVLFPGHFRVPENPLALGVHLAAWGGFLILAGWVVGIQRDRLEREIRNTQRLNEELRTSCRRVDNAQATTVLGLATLAECRDGETGRHLERVRECCRILAREIRRLPPYDRYITDAYVEDLALSSVLHDIGKVGVPDAILLKPGKLSEEEFATMKVHTVIGGNALRAIEQKIEGRSFLALGKEVAYCHHEWWDGSGYPRGLAGNDIPLSARIVSVADAYDAITSDRVYRPARPHAVAVEIIREHAGRQFDPLVVEAFLARESDILEMRLEQGGGVLSPAAAAASA